MSVPGYSAWSVTAGEQPTTAYWNILGSNDAAFNTALSGPNTISGSALVNASVPGTAMENIPKLGSFNCPSSAGNYSQTGIGFQPRMVKFFSATGTATTAAILSDCFMTSSAQLASGCYANGSQFTRYSDTSHCYVRCTSTVTPAILASAVSLDADGFTIDFSTVANNEPIFFVAFP